MSKKPLVSILIASYNKEKFVSRCIESCLFQSYKNIEIIFFDDGSTDNSYQIAKRYKKITLEIPIVHAVKKGLFYQWLASENKLGGQHKVPRLSNNRVLLEELLKINY